MSDYDWWQCCYITARRWSHMSQTYIGKSASLISCTIYSIQDWFMQPAIQQQKTGYIIVILSERWWKSITKFPWTLWNFPTGHYDKVSGNISVRRTDLTIAKTPRSAECTDCNTIYFCTYYYDREKNVTLHYNAIYRYILALFNYIPGNLCIHMYIL